MQKKVRPYVFTFVVPSLPKYIKKLLVPNISWRERKAIILSDAEIVLSRSRSTYYIPKRDHFLIGLSHKPKPKPFIIFLHIWLPYYPFTAKPPITGFYTFFGKYKKSIKTSRIFWFSQIIEKVSKRFFIKKPSRIRWIRKLKVKKFRAHFKFWCKYNKRYKRRARRRLGNFSQIFHKHFKAEFIRQKRFNLDLLMKSGNYRPENYLGFTYSRDTNRWPKRFMQPNEFLKIFRIGTTDYWTWPQIEFKPIFKGKPPKIKPRFIKLAIATIKSGLESFLTTRAFPFKWPNEQTLLQPIQKFLDETGSDFFIPGRRRMRVDFSTNCFRLNRSFTKRREFVPQIGRTLNVSLENAVASNYLAVEEGLKIDSTYLFSAVNDLFEPLYTRPYNLKVGGKINVAAPNSVRVEKPFNNLPIVQYNDWLFNRFISYRFKRAANHLISNNFWSGQRGAELDTFDSIFDLISARVVSLKGRTSFSFGRSAIRPTEFFKIPFVSTARVLTIKSEKKDNRWYKRLHIPPFEKALIHFPITTKNTEKPFRIKLIKKNRILWKQTRVYYARFQRSMYKRAAIKKLLASARLPKIYYNFLIYAK
jgi:hypothetical protein